MSITKNRLEKANAFFDKIARYERLVCCYLLIILVAITFVQVIMRSVFDAPFSWSEELTLMFLVWFGYLCIPLQIHTDSHASLYFLYNKLPALCRKVLDIGRHSILIWFNVEMIKYGMVITKLNMHKLQPATRFSQGWLFLPLVVGGVLMTMYSLMNLIAAIIRPLSDYPSNKAVKSVDEINIERGGSV